MTAVADLLSPAARERLAKRLAELRGLDAMMRQPGGMPAVPVPPPLHKVARRGQVSQPVKGNDHDRGGQHPALPASLEGRYGAACCLLSAPHLRYPR